MRKFTYSLDSLRRKREADSDELRQKRVEARSRLDACEQALQKVDLAIAETQMRVRALGHEGQAIDPDAQSRLSSYLRMLGVERTEKQRRLNTAQREFDDIGEKLRAVRQDIKTLEKHREGRKAEFDADQRRRDQALTDELWLLRR